MPTVRIVVLALLATAASSRGGCDGSQGGRSDPCAAKACGDRCTICPPDDPGCAETADVKACNHEGQCVSAGPLGCGETGACAGKACGDSCNSCDTPACQTFAATACDRSGRCATATPWLCYDPCAGKKCGEACSICPPDAAGCSAIACITACDGAGRCTCTGGGAACP